VSVDRTADGIALKFSEKARVSPEKLADFVSGHPGAVFTPNGVLRHSLGEDALDDLLNVAHGVLLNIRASD